MKPIIRNAKGQYVKGSGSPLDARVERICCVCSRVFLIQQKRLATAKFCSKSCFYNGRNTGGRLGSGAHGPRRNLMKNGYFRVNIDGRWIYEHRHVMQTRLGRSLERQEVVHHKDGNRQNNSIVNLELMEKRSHDSMESRERWAKIRASNAR